MDALIISCRFCKTETPYNADNVCPKCLEDYGRGLDGLPPAPSLSAQSVKGTCRCGGGKQCAEGECVCIDGWPICQPSSESTPRTEEDQRQIDFTMCL